MPLESAGRGIADALNALTMCVWAVAALLFTPRVHAWRLIRPIHDTEPSHPSGREHELERAAVR